MDLENGENRYSKTLKREVSSDPDQIYGYMAITNTIDNILRFRSDKGRDEVSRWWLLYVVLCSPTAHDVVIDDGG